MTYLAQLYPARESSIFWVRLGERMDPGIYCEKWGVVSLYQMHWVVIDEKWCLV